MTHICGSIGLGAGTRDAGALAASGRAPLLFARDNVVVYGDKRTAMAGGPNTFAWSLRPLKGLDLGHGRAPAQADVCSITAGGDGSVELIASSSGAIPLFVHLSEGPVHFSSTVALLVDVVSRPRMDASAWAQIISIGGPLAGRTPFEGIRRMQPGERILLRPDGGRRVDAAACPWSDAPTTPSGSIRDVRDALLDTMTMLGKSQTLSSLLSGGWDSRILAVIAARLSPSPLHAWTTSSDVGTALEELVAAQVAHHIGAHHHIIAPRFDEFESDVRAYNERVDYQSSFHVWLTPLARSIPPEAGTLLDGLGGGIFLGGAFPDPEGSSSLIERRFARLARYLGAARDIVRSSVAAQLEERTRSDFDRIARPLLDHPAGTALTAYLTRTLPGISLGPLAVVGGERAVATPFLSHAVVHAGLRLPHADHAEGYAYPRLVRLLARGLERIPTAASLTPRHRRHPRRAASRDAAVFYRRVLLQGEVAGMLAPALLNAEVEVWQRHLSRTRQQHLIRSLAMLALWLDRYRDKLSSPQVDEFLAPTG